MLTRLFTFAALLALTTSAASCAGNSSRDPYGAATDSTITAKVDSTRSDTLNPTMDTTSTAR
jgi:ABC-type phosphate/phosphonate transport system substrate-binding protein